jgi:hypothetical protein
MWSANIGRALASNNADIVRDTLTQFRENGKVAQFGPEFCAAKDAQLTQALQALHVSELLAAMATGSHEEAREAQLLLYRDGLCHSAEAVVAAAEAASLRPLTKRSLGR